ncbi:hypothetical protein PSTG_19792 [Puccinia striiformis f. sp. tritici PST-78]|uniref:Uncharacterized protein n=1 Tax=Puccinia striiformis f. sp. tritici PST-78 TaxID=1165861 RepID=A0A0L0UIK5_9BASI|nr:hypothetical protein PSTG_19792 [Puccinia striiformis f. sp. tritici PST-78]
MGWRCGFPPDRWMQRRGLLLVPRRASGGGGGRQRGTDGEAYRRESSGRRGRREQPDARRELGERQPWMRQTIERGTAEERFQRTPTWRAKMSDIGFRQNP